MPRKRLTDLFVEGLKPPTRGRLQYYDTIISGLALRVTETSVKTWSTVYRDREGKQQRYTIGRFPTFKTADARNAARQALHRLEAGGDPAAEKRARRLAPKPPADDFASVAREYLERQVRRNNAPKTLRETRGILERDAIPEWGKRAIGSIAKRDIIALLDKKVAAGAGVQANRVRTCVQTLFEWARAKDLIAANPCDGVKAPTKERARDRILSDDEIQAFWTATGELGWPHGPLFRLLLLTGQRRDEVGRMEWSEVDLERRLWSLRRERVKNDQGHDVHLSAQAVEILTALPRIAGPYVFSMTGKRPVCDFSRRKERLDSLMAKALGEDVEPWVLHDLRRTAATGMARLKIAPHILDRCLNHTSGTIRGVARIYNRFDYLDERRVALETWGRALEAIVQGGAGSNVVELATARA